MLTHRLLRVLGVMVSVHGLNILYEWYGTDLIYG